MSRLARGSFRSVLRGSACALSRRSVHGSLRDPACELRCSSRRGSLRTLPRDMRREFLLHF
jgi:hypothetical protein